MGFVSNWQNEGGDGGGDGGGFSWGLRNLVRRKKVDSSPSDSSLPSSSGHGRDHHQLAKALTVPHLIAIGN